MIPRITAKFGEINAVHQTPHTGVDFAIPEGTGLYAPINGFVSRIIDNESIGKAVVVKTKTGYQYIFGHLSEVKVKMGERIHTGELLALSGNTGNSTGAHLHLGLVNGSGEFVNPLSDGIIGKIMGKAADSVQDRARQWVYDGIIGTLEALRDVLVDLSYSIALIGGGLAIILHVAGWEDGKRWAGILTVAYVLIKYLLG